jgi:hypothetical protein
MNNDPERLDADELAGRWLDDEALPADASMDDAGRRRVAELQLLHGLLSQLHDDSDARARRLQRVLDALRQSANILPYSAAARPRRNQARRVLAWLASAAAMLLIGLLAWKLVSPNPAYAVVERAAEAAGREHDRTYRVVDQWSGAVTGTREATLYVRGDRFVFQPKRPLIRGLLLGSDGRRGWAVKSVGPVVVSDDPLEFFHVMTRGLLPPPRAQDKPSSQAMLPLLQQHTLLRRLGQSYRLELLASTPLTEGDDIRYHHIRAQRQSDAAGGAEVVELWVHPRSSIVARLQLQAKLEPGRRLVTLDLTSEEPLPPDWYEHSAHHEADRPVKDWQPAEGPLPGVIPPAADNKP